MALCGFKSGNATFSERYNRSWFHKHKCIHKKDATVFHPIIHRRNIQAGRLYRNQIAFY